MKTLLISEVFPPRLGGTATLFYKVYSHYPPGEAVVLTDLQPGDENFDKGFSFPVVRVPLSMNEWGFLNPGSVRRYFRHMLQTRTIVRRRQIQIVHCARVMPEGVFAYLLHAVSKTPYCVYAHGEEIGTALSSRQLRVLMNRVYGSAETIVANSQNTRTLLVRTGVPDSKIAVVFPGVDANRFYPGNSTEARKKLGISGQPVLLSVGRLQRRKGHDRVLQSLPRLLSELPGLAYVIAGAGEEEARLKEMAESLNVSRHVHFAGAVPDGLLPDYYRACDVFIMPNREESHHDIEGFGIVFLEANACCKPVIGGKSGGTADAVVDGETGFLVNPEDPVAIADAALLLCRDKTLAAELGHQGRTRAVRQFGWASVANKVKLLTEANNGGSVKKPGMYSKINFRYPA